MIEENQEIQIAVDKDRNYCNMVCPQMRLDYVGGDSYYCLCEYFGKLGWYPFPKRSKECKKLTGDK